MNNRQKALILLMGLSISVPVTNYGMPSKSELLKPVISCFKLFSSKKYAGVAVVGIASLVVVGYLSKGQIIGFFSKPKSTIASEDVVEQETVADTQDSTKVMVPINKQLVGTLIQNKQTVPANFVDLTKGQRLQFKSIITHDFELLKTQGTSDINSGLDMLLQDYVGCDVFSTLKTYAEAKKAYLADKSEQLLANVEQAYVNILAFIEKNTLIKANNK